LFVEFDCASVTKKKIKILISYKNILVAQVSKIFESWLKLCQYFKNNSRSHYLIRDEQLQKEENFEGRKVLLKVII